MKVRISALIIGVFIITSCSKEERCECNQYLKSSNGNVTIYGGASMQLCDGTVPNPNPTFYIYKKECN